LYHNYAKNKKDWNWLEIFCCGKIMAMKRAIKIGQYYKDIKDFDSGIAHLYEHVFVSSLLKIQ
jgi:hypothetical protein